MSQTVLTNTYDDAELFRLIESENGVGKSTTYEYGDGLSPSYGIPNLITSDGWHGQGCVTRNFQ